MLVDVKPSNSLYLYIYTHTHTHTNTHIFQIIIIIFLFRAASAIYNCTKKNKIPRNKFYQDLFFFFLGLHKWHMEVPRLGVKSELQLPAYTTATATLDLSCIWDLLPQLAAMPDF